jgi:hypothetical protein
MADLITNGNQELEIIPGNEPAQVFPTPPNCIAPIADQATLAGSPMCVGSDRAGGHAALAKANAASTAFCIGLAIQFAEDDAPVYICYAGPVQLTAAEWDAIVTGESGGLSTGTTYYVSSTSAGKLTSVAPSAGGTFTSPVGVALSPLIMIVGQHVPAGPH